MPKLVVFDVDGTILDSFGLFERVIRHYSDTNNMPHPCMESIKLGYADPATHDFKWGIPKEEQKKHLNEAFILSDSWSQSGDDDKTPLLFGGVEDMLVTLKNEGFTLAIVTSKAEAPLLHLLDFHGIEHLFATHRNWDDEKRRGHKHKPSPDMLNCVMEELKFKPQDTVMIGDTTMDIGMGLNAGTHTIGVSWGSHPVDKLKSAGAHHIVDTHPGDFVPVIKKIFA